MQSSHESARWRPGRTGERRKSDGLESMPAIARGEPTTNGSDVQSRLAGSQSPLRCRSVAAQLRRSLDQPLGKLREEVIVRGALLTRARRGLGRAFRVVQHDDFNAAVIVGFAAAELAQAEDRQAARLALLRPRSMRRLAEFGG